MDVPGIPFDRWYLTNEIKNTGRKLDKRKKLFASCA